MPSYALNQFTDLDDVLCKHLLNLDLREPMKTSPDSPCTLSSGGSGLSIDSMESGPMSAHYWGAHRAHCPSRWGKMNFWCERSVSMVEDTAGSLGWSSTEPDQLKPSPASLCGSTNSSRYKTELCRTFAERGMCKYGGKCQFAHGPHELRDLNRHPKYKTEPCRTFHSIGFCPYGIRCHFVHNSDDDTPPPPRSAPRRPLLKQSFSFAGFPSSPQPLQTPPPSSFLRSPSVSAQMATPISDLLSLAFPDVDANALLEQVHSQFLPSPDSPGSSQGLSPSQTEASSRRSPVGSASLGFRSLSHTSLSDQEGGSCSSSSSMSGSESSFGMEAGGRRLPIFSQLSVPEDGVGNSPTSFFL